MTVRQFIWSWQSAEFSAFWVLWSVVTGLPGVAVLRAVLSMLLLRALIIGLVCVLVTGHFSQNSLSPVKWIRYWIGEVAAFVSLYSLWQMLPRRRVQPVESVSGHHVILAHGFLCNDGFWFRLIPRLQRAGFSVSTVEQPEVFGDIDDFQQRLCSETERVLAENPMVRVTLVGFSMGGLAARRLPVALQQRCDLITVYSPHFGTVQARLTRPFRAVNGRQMRPGNPWLRTLNQAPIGYRRTLGFWSEHDTIIAPPIRGRAPFEHRTRLGYGHLSAALDRDLHRQLVAWLQTGKHD